MERFFHTKISQLNEVLLAVRLKMSFVISIVASMRPNDYKFK